MLSSPHSTLRNNCRNDNVSGGRQGGCLCCICINCQGSLYKADNFIHQRPPWAHLHRPERRGPSRQANTYG